MARARNIKPGFFKNEDLAECSPWARLCFAGLWTLADRDGRLEDRPKRIKGELFPFDTVDVEPLLQELARFKFIVRYETDGMKALQISEFQRHQSPHYSENASVIKPPKLPESWHRDESSKPDNSEKEQPIKRGSQPPDSLNPDSLNPSNPPTPARRGSRRSGSVHPFPPGFEAIWSAYPLKTAMDSAAKAFAKLGAVDDALLARMLAAIEVQRESPQWAKDGGQFVPHLAKWLKGRRWEDEAGAPSSNGSAIPDAAETAARLAAEREHDERAMLPEAHAARRRAMEQIHGVSEALTRTKR